jgi:hypothetical protein
VPWKGLDEGVDVVGHHDPCQKTIALLVEVEQGILGSLGDDRVGEMTAAETGVQEGRDSRAQVPLFVAVVVGDLTPPTIKGLAREGVGEAKGDRLNGTSGVEVGEVAPRVPATVPVRAVVRFVFRQIRFSLA